jgi:hypothetical protein
MAQTLCIKCGSELTPSSYCELCKEPLIFACISCNYITEEKVHADCRNANELTKTTDATIMTAEGGEAAASIQTPTSSTRRNEEKIDKRIEHEVTIVEPKPQPASSQSTGEENNNNPFVLSTTQRLWQSLIANWYNAYGEFLKSSTTMTEHWYNTYWKPWLKAGQWQQMQKQQKDRDKVNVE